MAIDINLEKPRGLTFVQLGDENCKVEATGKFDDKDTHDYVPNPDSDSLHIDVPLFEGPLDLLLHLIKRHSMDIFDIPIVLITQKYVEALDQMTALDLDLAGDFLVMAATLTQIKSKMLLPVEEQEADAEDLDDEDPRAELMRRLLEYQAFKEVAAQLSLNRNAGLDTFKRCFDNDWIVPEEVDVLSVQQTQVKPVEVYELIEIFAKALEKYKPKLMHEVQFERVGIRMRITELIEFARVKLNFSFDEALTHFGVANRIDVIVTFLAILEMSRMKLISVAQEWQNPEILVSAVEENIMNSNEDLIADLDDENEDAEKKLFN
ncbi:MAG: segregation/condensation protein A [bacterium]|nr:segregation/condensation protein A [bacterium]